MYTQYLVAIVIYCYIRCSQNNNRKKIGFGIRYIGLEVLSLPLISCMTLGKYLVTKFKCYYYLIFLKFLLIEEKLGTGILVNAYSARITLLKLFKSINNNFLIVNFWKIHGWIWLSIFCDEGMYHKWLTFTVAIIILAHVMNQFKSLSLFTKLYT